jgi:hypothetical protein
MKKYLSILLIALTATGLTSCLKDGKVNLPEGGSPPVVEFSTNLFASPSSDPASPVAVYTKSYSLGAVANLEINIGYTGGSPAPQDITVTLDTAGNKTTPYNEFTGEHYTNVPANAFVLPSSVVIKKGENLAKLTIQIKPDLFDLTANYVLPLHIASTTLGQVSGNYGTILIAVGAKNKYDGVYTVTGTLVDNAAPTITGLYPSKYQLITQSATKVAQYDAYTFGDFYHLINSAGATNVYGSFAPVFTFDDAGNITAVTNYYGQPAANGRSAKLDPTGVNKITGTQGTAGFSFQVKYQMLQPGTTVRTQFDEKFTYIEPRP